MKRKAESECPQDCPGRSATCHATCKIHLEGWESRRMVEQAAMHQNRLKDYTVKEIEKAKTGRYSHMDRFRPKERRKG